MKTDTNLSNNKIQGARIEFIDLAKGLCIILVVLHHFEGKMHIYLPIDPYLRMFRMPLYFLLSGLFFKEYENFSGFIKRKINKLLIPFLFWFLLSDAIIPLGIGLIRDGLSAIVSFDWNRLFSFLINEKVQNTPVWFLWCLFIMNVFFYLIFLFGKKCGDKCCPIAIASTSLILGVIGYLFGCSGRNIPAFIDSSFTAMPFFATGYLLNKYTSVLRPNPSDKYIIFEIIVCSLLTILCTTGNLNYRTNIYELNLICLYVGGFCGALAVIFIAKCLTYIPLISFWGRYSIIILVTHHYFVMPMVLMIIRKVGLAYNICSLFISVFVTMVLYMLLIPIVKKLLPHVTAQKDVIKIKSK